MQSSSATPLAPPPPPEAAPLPPAIDAELRQKLGHELAVAAARLRRGANWFYWIAAMTGINTVMELSGSGFHFILGLGLTQLIDGVAIASAKRFGGGTHVVAIGLDLAIIGVWVGLAMWAHRARSTAFWLGMVFFALDGLLLMAFGDWLSVAFHAYAIFGLWNGLQAVGRLRALGLKTAN